MPVSSSMARSRTVPSSLPSRVMTECPSQPLARAGDAAPASAAIPARPTKSTTQFRPWRKLFRNIEESPIRRMTHPTSDCACSRPSFEMSLKGCTCLLLRAPVGSVVISQRERLRMPSGDRPSNSGRAVARMTPSRFCATVRTHHRFSSRGPDEPSHRRQHASIRRLVDAARRHRRQPFRLYGDDSWRPCFARLRREDPVHYCLDRPGPVLVRDASRTLSSWTGAMRSIRPNSAGSPSPKMRPKSARQLHRDGRAAARRSAQDRRALRCPDNLRSRAADS